jgi:hypothetical protein
VEYEPYSVRYRLSCGHMLARCGRLYSRVSSRARGASPWSLEAGGGSDGSRTGNDIGQRPTSNDLALLSSRRTFFFIYFVFSGGGNRESGNGVFPVGVTASPRGGRARSGYAYGLWRLFISFLPPTADTRHMAAQRTTSRHRTRDSRDTQNPIHRAPKLRQQLTRRSPVGSSVRPQTTDLTRAARRS